MPTPLLAPPVPRPAAFRKRSPIRAGAPFVLTVLVLLGGCGGGAEDDATPAPGPDVPVAGEVQEPARDPDAAGATDPSVQTDSAAEPGRSAAQAGTDAARPGTASASGADTLSGVVGTFGAEPLVHHVLELPDGRSIPLGTAAGDLRAEADPEGPLVEIARLTGARIRVTGTADAFAAAPARGFAVDGYELLEVEGERPVVGRLVRGDPGRGTPDRLEVGGAMGHVVVGLPEGSPASGSRLWILGTLRGDSLLVQAYGVLRPAEG